MQDWKRRLSAIGDVETLDYAYMREGRKRPDPLPKLIANCLAGRLGPALDWIIHESEVQALTGDLAPDSGAVK